MSFKEEVLGGVGRRVKSENRRELEECLDSQATLHPFFLIAPVLALPLKLLQAEPEESSERLGCSPNTEVHNFL